ALESTDCGYGLRLRFSLQTTPDGVGWSNQELVVREGGGPVTRVRQHQFSIAHCFCSCAATQALLCDFAKSLTVKSLGYQNWANRRVESNGRKLRSDRAGKSICIFDSVRLDQASKKWTRGNGRKCIR